MINALGHLEKCRLAAPLGDALVDAVRSGNQSISFIAACRPAMVGMGTTLTAVALGNDGCYIVANVGDSRTYLLRAGRLTQLTRDESYVQQLIEKGELSPEEARLHPQRSLVMRALDGGPDDKPVLRRVKANLGDRLLLCSDGLSDSIHDQAIAHAIAEPHPHVAADALVAAALRAGARDNVSVIVADVVLGAAPALWPHC
jgi:PPM family protein phosphatase